MSVLTFKGAGSSGIDSIKSTKGQRMLMCSVNNFVNIAEKEL